MDMLSQSTKLNDAFMWWWEGLQAWLPASIQQKTQRSPVIQCSIEDDQLTLYMLDKTGTQRDKLLVESSLNSIDKNAVEKWLKRYRHYEVVLRIADDQCLIKPISLPAGARDNLNEMIKFEIDRQTPFAADKVYVGYRVTDSSDAKGQPLSVTLAVVPKQFVTNIIEQLASIAISITSLSVAGNTINISIADSTTVQPVTTRLNYSLAALAFVLLVLFFYLPIRDYDNAIETIQTPLGIAKKQARVVAKLKDDNVSMMEQAQFVDDKLRNYRARLVILTELASTLPAHTWLEQSEVRHNVLTIRGESDSASDLVALLTNLEYFSNVRFSSPTTRNDKTGKDRFKIQALIVSEEMIGGH
jgi:general secretion pathway protein L